MAGDLALWLGPGRVIRRNALTGGLYATPKPRPLRRPGAVGFDLSSTEEVKMLPFVLLTASWPRYRQDRRSADCGSGAVGEAPADQKPHRKIPPLWSPRTWAEIIACPFGRRNGGRRRALRAAKIRAETPVALSNLPEKGG